MQNSSAEMPTFNYLTNTGDISINPLPANEKVLGGSWIYLIMGPTGAGKSTFIEALSGGTQNLQISKDQLAGYTQSVTAYRMTNVQRFDFEIYLVDTPGFSDIKISEIEIMDNLRHWMAQNDFTYFNQILFLTPVTEPRLAGSKRKTIEMLKALLKPADNLHSITFVTTMWDQLHGERTQRRAESSFEQLRGEILKEFIDKGATIEKFMNTRNSALQILDSYLGAIHFASAVPNVSLHLYQDLHKRIEGALQQKKTLESDLASPEAQTSVALISILEKNHRENEETLAKFLGRFLLFGKPPEGFENAHRELLKVVDPLSRSRLFDIQYKPGYPSYDPLDNLNFDLMERQCTDTTHLTIPCPTSLVQIHPTRMLTLKGLLRRLIRATKHRGKKWVRKSKD